MVLNAGDSQSHTHQVSLSIALQDDVKPGRSRLCLHCATVMEKLFKTFLSKNFFLSGCFENSGDRMGAGSHEI